MALNQETRVGFFVLGGLSILVFGIVTLAGIEWRPKPKYNVDFQNVQGLTSRSQVYIRGTPVGKISRIELEKDRVKVTVWLEPFVEVYEDAQARILTTGFVGNRYLEILPGSPNRPRLKSGQTIRGIEPIGLDERIDKAIRALDSLVSTIQEIAGEGGLKTILRNVVDTSRNIRQISLDVREITSENKDKVATILDRMDSLIITMEGIAKKIDSGEGLASEILNDKQLVDDLKTAMKDVRDASRNAKQLLTGVTVPRLQFGYGLRYDISDKRFRHDLRIRLGLKHSRFVALAVENIGPPSDLDRQKRSSITAVAGQEIADGKVAFYGGAIRSEGGLGVSLSPVQVKTSQQKDASRYNAVTFFVEAYDLDRKTPKRAPIMRAGVEARPVQWLRIGTHAEDLLYRKRWNVETGVVLQP